MIRWLGVIKPGTIINDIGAHEDTYNWTNGEWTVPINFQISQVFKIGDQPMQASVGPRY
jgi:hypothetical protein